METIKVLAEPRLEVFQIKLAFCLYTREVITYLQPSDSLIPGLFKCLLHPLLGAEECIGINPQDFLGS